MSATVDREPDDLTPTPTPASTPTTATDGIARVDVTGLDAIAPGVSVLASRRRAPAAGGRIVRAQTTGRGTSAIPGLQILVDIAASSRAPTVTSTGLVPLVEVRRDGVTIHADELHPGDVIDYGGHLHCVTKVDRGEGWSWPIASDDDGWSMALGHDLIVLHHRAP